MLLDEFGPVEIGEASTAREVFALLEKERWDVLLLDITMPGMNGLDAASRITESQPEIPVILFSLHLSEDVIDHFQKDGIRGAVSKGDAARDLVAAVETVLSGGNFFPTRKSPGKLTH